MTKSPHPSSVDKGELLPCPNPWCSGVPKHGWPNTTAQVVRREVTRKLRVRCNCCEMEGPRHDTEAEAVTAWNTRSQSRSLPGDALRLLSNVTQWLTAALECETWAWDGEQREAATMDRDAARAALPSHQGAEK